MRCSVQNCNNDTRRTTKSHGITFHMFPKEQNLRTAWIEALGMPDWEPRERSTVCSEHFKSNDFYLTKNGLRKIKNGAVPVVIKESAEDMDAPAALRVCRVCLSMDTRMYHISDYKLNIVYEQVVGVPFTDEDKLPQKICWECAHRLISANSLKVRALRSQTLLYELLDPERYITIRDVKSINRTHNHLVSSLVHKHFDPNDCDTHIQDNQIVVKEESNVREDREEGEERAEEERSEGDVKEELTQVKDETSNEIFFEEFADNFDDSDDMALSEMYADVSKKSEKKKKKVKVGKKVKEKKAVKRKAGSESPTSTMDKYKTNDVKRRATTDNIDETLFTITHLTYEEQVEEVERRQQHVSYTSAVYQCAACYRGFQRKDRYDAHVLRHSEQSGAYECFICRTRLKTARALRKHLTAQHTLKYSCKGCTFVTRNKGVAREHEKWHAGAKYQCPHCPSEFDKLTTYLGHVRIKHVSDCVCELCGFTFVSKKGIDVHKKKKHRLADNPVLEGPYCDICDVRFVNEEAHDRHLKLSSKHSSDDDPNRIRNDSQNMSSESNGRVMRKIERRPVIHPRGPNDVNVRSGGPVTCEQCGVQLRDLRLYAQHFRRAHPDKNRTKYPAMKTPCMCEQCGRIFQSMALLKDHMWVHTGEKRFKCERCDKSFTQKTNLVFHMRVHSAQRPSYECPLCGKQFAFFNNRRRHMFVSIPARYQKRFKCERCDKSFTQKTNLVFHMRVHSAQRPSYECPLCGKQFAFFNNRRRHMFVSIPARYQKRFKCERCDKSFTQKTNLVFHMRVHSAQRPSYECPLCGKQFAFFNNRRRHMFVSIPARYQKRFKCERCDKSFTQKTNLVFHMRVHSAQRPSYECPLCGKQFAFFNNRRRHMFIHTGLKPHKCETCGKSFTTAGEQRAHVEHVHMKKPWPRRARVRPPTLPHPLDRLHD